MKSNLFGLLLLLISIGFIESKTEKLLRSYVFQPDTPIRQNRLSNFTIFDSTETKILYRVRCSTRDFDTMVVIRYPNRDVFAYAEGVWVETPFNVTFSVYNKKDIGWTDGIVKKKRVYFNNALIVPWKRKELIMRKRTLSRKTVFYYESNGNQILARSAVKSWFGKERHTLSIFDDTVPDALTFVLLAMLHQRTELEVND